MKVYKLKFSPEDLAVNGKPIAEMEKTLKPEQIEAGVRIIGKREKEKGVLSQLAEMVFARENKISVFNEMRALVAEIKDAGDDIKVSETDVKRLRESAETLAKKLEDRIGELYSIGELIGQLEKPEEVEVK